MYMYVRSSWKFGLHSPDSFSFWANKYIYRGVDAAQKRGIPVEMNNLMLNIGESYSSTANKIWN